MTTPIIDWELGIKLAGNNAQAAEEMLVMLVKSLPSELSQINNAYEQKQYSEVTRLAHRLHGALCYCGVPRFKAATQQLEETSRSKDIKNLDSSYKEFEQEAKALLDACHANM